MTWNNKNFSGLGNHQYISPFCKHSLFKTEILFQVKDICNELEVKLLCHKILQNVSMLLNADRGSLFLVQGERADGRQIDVSSCFSSCSSQTPRGRFLVSKLFDVCSKSTLTEMEKKEEIRIPWGTGIVGYVAESGEAVNIPDAYQVSQGEHVGVICCFYYMQREWKNITRKEKNKKVKRLNKKKNH